ncbi:DUF1707 domain-containing protein [Prauserella oleivorans]|uniref:DUF1707 domain-containing protein n=1 Tax=Prauserella oleivorans TaxID=1478153 RepID=A0ABW5W5Y2_9PSEU
MTSDPDPERLRIGTAEREEATRLLADHFAEGRLTTSEYDERVSAALAAQTRADIRPLFADLPAPEPAFLRPPPLEPYRYPTSLAPSADRGTSDRSRIVAGVLQIVLPFGVGRFYTGQKGLALAQLLVTLFTFGMGAIWPFIDGILLLVNGGEDGRGRRLRD